jgi:hypothetical protein
VAAHAEGAAASNPLLTHALAGGRTGRRGIMRMPVGTRPGPAASRIHASPGVIIPVFPTSPAVVPCGHGDVRLGGDRHADDAQHGQSRECGHDGSSVADTLTIRWLLSLGAICPVASRCFTCRCSAHPAGRRALRRRLRAPLRGHRRGSHGRGCLQRHALGVAGRDSASRSGYAADAAENGRAAISPIAQQHGNIRQLPNLALAPAQAVAPAEISALSSSVDRLQVG